MKNYFENTADADMKITYRRLCQTMHPDRGGNTSEFQEMKRQYEHWEKTGYKWKQSTQRQQTSNPQGKQTSRYVGGYRVVGEGRWTFDLDEVLSSRARYRTSDGNLFVFNPVWWVANGQTRTIVDDDMMECIIVRGVFSLDGELHAIATINHSQIHEESMKVRVFDTATSTFLGEVKIPTPNFNKFKDRKDEVVMTVEVSTAHLLHELKVWDNRGVLWDVGTKKFTLTITKLADETDVKRTFYDRMLDAWKEIKKVWNE